MKNYEDAQHHNGLRSESIDMTVLIFLAYLDVLNGKENMISPQASSGLSE